MGDYSVDAGLGMDLLQEIIIRTGRKSRAFLAPPDIFPAEPISRAKCPNIRLDGLVKSLKLRSPVLPANPGSGQAPESSIIDDLVKSHQNHGFDCWGVRWTPMIERAPLVPTMPGAQKLRSEAHLQVRRNDEVAAQSRSERDRWTCYETIN
jgi:hypothetical protein